jgi:hypothetical protein
MSTSTDGGLTWATALYPGIATEQVRWMMERSDGQPVAAKLNAEVTLHLALNEPGRARLLVVPIRPSQDFGFQPLG